MLCPKHIRRAIRMRLERHHDPDPLRGAAMGVGPDVRPELVLQIWLLGACWQSRLDSVSGHGQLPRFKVRHCRDSELGADQLELLHECPLFTRSCRRHIERPALARRRQVFHSWVSWRGTPRQLYGFRSPSGTQPKLMRVFIVMRTAICGSRSWLRVRFPPISDTGLSPAFAALTEQP